MNLEQKFFNEETTKKELLFALSQRDKPTLAFVECGSLAKRNELDAELASRLPEYQFHTIDVTPFPVVSLLRTLTERLPEKVRSSSPVTYVVNVHGLENSLLVSQDGQFVPSLMTAQLNLERELLFRSVPYIVILWGDTHFFRTLQREAPDLWHWVTYKFRFEDYTARPAEQLPPLPAERLPQKGNIAERQERIRELRDRYEHLLLDDSDKKRLLKDKITILSLLAQEYTQAFDYIKAEESYQTAISLQEILRIDDNSRGKLLFDLATVYLSQKRFAKAVTTYERSKRFSSKESLGSIHFQIGKAFSKQGQWSKALGNYHQSIRWLQSPSGILDLGDVYHQIGVLYEAQSQWRLALTNFNQALLLHQATFTALGINHTSIGIGFAYHHIGRVYMMMEQWAPALENYQQAIFWKHKTSNIFELGSTYHQIGILFEMQQQWIEALENHQQALAWNKKTSNDFQLGTTYYHTGLVYGHMGVLIESISWFEKAIENFTCYNRSLLPEARKALAIVQEMLKSSL